MIDNIHDNEIISYNVDFRKQKIIFNTLNYRNKKVIIEFTGLLAHKFELEQPNSIILDIEESKVEKMIEENTELLLEMKNNCWPIFYDNMKDLLEKLNIDKYKYYIIYSSIGLCGWIIAKNIEVKNKDI